jgi:hypothetical protein
MGKDNTSERSAYETVMRMLRASGMASRGNGRTLVTDNWYSSGSLMAGVWTEFGITFMGTIYLTNKKSRTADDFFPFHKLSKGALRRVKRGWSRTATQNVKIVRQTAFTMQAGVWRDKKQESHMECSTRSPRYPGFESLSPDSHSPLRCLLRHQVSIQRRRNLWDQVRVKFVGKECRVWKTMKERL